MGSGVFSVPGWGLLAVDLSLAGILLILPLRRPSRDDRGDGLSHVVLPANRPISHGRTLFYYLCLAGASTLLLAVPGLVPSYRAMVARVVLEVYGHPTAVPVYTGHLDAALRILVVIDLVCLMVTVPAGPGRRLVLGLHAVGYLVLSVVVDTVIMIAAMSVHLPLGSYAFVATMANLFVAALVMLRIVITTFSLPGPSGLVPGGAPRRGAAVVFCVALIAVIALLLAMLAVLTVVAAAHPNVGLALFLGYPLLFTVFFIILLGLGGPIRRPSQIGPLPPLDVIMPAYNEAEDIADSLRAIDQAAAHYGGPVRVVVGDDGSTDATIAVVAAAMDHFRAASGRIAQIPHQGKAHALNAALSETTADIVIRIDADVIIHRQALAGVPRWFSDPTVGTVGAFMMPDPRGHSFFHRMRGFECLFSFGFCRQALARVDAVTCIPGTFAAFRREPVVRFGGFVTGMNGEDADLTMQLGRLGYRAVVDPAIKSFEDVPSTLSAFCAQRVRWNRAGIQVMSRHSPLSGGESSPQTWFLFLRTGMIRVASLLRPLVYIHALQVAIFVPTLRHEIGFVGLLYLFGALPVFIPIVVLSIRHGYWTKLGWMLFWYPFSLLRRVIVLESLLTLPPRPVLRITRPATVGRDVRTRRAAATTTEGL